MDAVVLHSDIARFVLGYLKRQNLEQTARSFCKTSPHLRHEFSAYKKGFTPYSFCPELEDIICEYVNIERTVNGILESLPKKLRLSLFDHKLCEKVKFLLERGLDSYLQNEKESDVTNKYGNQHQSSMASISIHSDKENTAKKENKQKRKRPSFLSSSDDRKSSGTIGNKPAKRRRLLERFCFLSSKQIELQRRHESSNTSSTSDGKTQTDDEYDEETVNEDEIDVGEDQERNASFHDTSSCLADKPTKESTPRNKLTKEKFLTPSVPELSQAILDNPQFQMKLVDNINQALSSSTNKEEQIGWFKNQENVLGAVTVNAPSTGNITSEEQQIINSNEMLDQMVRDILKATEKDPAFDAIIENVIGVSKQSTNVSAGMQCNIDNAVGSTSMVNMQNPTIVGALQQNQQQQIVVVQQNSHQQQPQPHYLNTMPNLTTISHQATETNSVCNVPRTPLIIRNAVAAGSSLNSAGGESQMLSSLTSNNSFGSLIDPNFSISKLIVLNSNESAQKQPPSADQSIGNSTADHIINQLTAVEGSTEEQVYFDANTGQLTIPLFLADEGLLTNFPFLVNNEAITQQLQPDNICNLDGSNIEIPLPEPIIVSADQLPPNSIIVTSSQKAITAEEQRLPSAPPPRTECKKPKSSAAPSSLNVRLLSDQGTPSTKGMMNTKAYKSLSTPRKRTSHVRTLSFSPTPKGATPLSPRCEVRHEATSLLETKENEGLRNSTDAPVKPIIKNVEILPCFSGSTAMTAIVSDGNANESSNSCSVPPLFVNEESSNQTVIKTELSMKEGQDIYLPDKITRTLEEKDARNNLSIPNNHHTDTPKRRQVRRTAVRGCKRQISKSSDEGDKKTIAATKTETETGKILEITPVREEPRTDKNEAKSNNEKMMEEWLRFRSASTSDLDSRLRQLNAEHTADLPKSGLHRKRDTPKKRKSRRKKSLVPKCLTNTVDDDVPEPRSSNGANTDAKLRDNDEKFEKKLKTKSGQGKKRSSKDRSREFNIKIPTPQKDKRESAIKMKNEIMENTSPEVAVKVIRDSIDQTFEVPKECGRESNPKSEVTDERLEQERDRRTANIACLLETPFKAPNTIKTNEVPPTPGISPCLLETPATKLSCGTGETHSTSYLFGSLTKSDLETPQLSAITPGIRFTPFGSSRDVTPRSIAPATDYSSGGSYYKPDESDDLDRNFEKNLSVSTQKVNEEEDNRSKALEKFRNPEEVETSMCQDQKASAVCVEIATEKLRVEPLVLKRVKSFGADGEESVELNAEGLNVDPHYTLVSELPEICAEDESSDSSSILSSSSSSLTDSSSTSSSSSHSAELVKEKAMPCSVNPYKTPDKLRLSLDNLSSISSTEDEDWQKLAVTEEDNSQLVSNDGEVRYPVRSWLTPNKANKEAIPGANETIIKVTVPLKSAEKRNRLEDDLQLKRERIMEKLKRDASQRREKQSNFPSTSPSGMSAALNATRKIAAMRDKSNQVNIRTSTLVIPKPVEPAVVVVEESRTIEVLTALQLSAKKTATHESAEVESKRRALGQPTMVVCDDNAVSTLFSNTTTMPNELTEKAERLPLKTLISKIKAKQKKCLQIEPIPVLKNPRSSKVGRKKIVRNPLGFKGTVKLNAIEDLEEVKSPLKVVTKNSSKCGTEKNKEKCIDEGQSSKVIPVPRSKIKTTSVECKAIASSKVRVSPRLRANKESQQKDDAEVAPVVPKRQLKIKKTTPTRKLRSGRIQNTKAVPEKISIPTDDLNTACQDVGSGKAAIHETCVRHTTDEKREKSLKKESEQIPKIENVNKEKQFKTKVIPVKTAVTATICDTKTDIFEEPNTVERTDRVEGTTTKSEKAVEADKTKTIREVLSGLKTVDRNITGAQSKPEIDDESCKKENTVISVNTIEGSSGDEKNTIISTSAVEHLTSNNSGNTATPTSTTNIESALTEISEDDPLEGCGLTSVTEDDPVRYISVTYMGSDVSPSNPLPRRDFTNFKMVVAFDENEKHIWRISDELVLFNTSSSTQQIRNIPKKRKVRIDTCGSDDDKVDLTFGVVHSTTKILPPSTTSRGTMEAVTSSINNTPTNSSSAKAKQPVATSTPRGVAAISSTEEAKKKQEIKEIVVFSKESSASTSAPQPVDSTEILQMDEIESLLSHLHGKEK